MRKLSIPIDNNTPSQSIEPNYPTEWYVEVTLYTVAFKKPILVQAMFTQSYFDYVYELFLYSCLQLYTEEGRAYKKLFIFI